MALSACGEDIPELSPQPQEREEQVPSAETPVRMKQPM